MANQQEIKVKINDDQLKGVYANFMRVSHQEGEFVMDFAHIVPPTGIVTARVITSPAHLKQIIKALETNLAEYEKKFGKVEEAGDREEEVGFHD